MMAGRKQSRPKYSAPRLEDCGRGEDSLDRGSGDSDDELEMRPQGGEETNEWDEIEMSRKDSSKEEDGGEKAVAKKRNVEGFLQRVNVNKRKFIRYQTAQHKARLKRRLGIPQTSAELRELEESKLQASELETAYIDEMAERNSSCSKFSSRSAPPFLLETPGGGQSPMRKRVSVQPKDFKRKDDYVFFDLFTLYAESYLGRGRGQAAVIEEEESEFRSET